MYSRTITKTFTFSQNDLHWSQITIGGTTYDFAYHDGCDSRTADVDAPDLPAKEAIFSIPFDYYVTKVKVTSTDSTTISGSKNMLPCYPPPIGDSMASPKKDDAFYLVTYPFQIAELSMQDWSAGYHMATVRIYPIAYDPGDNQTILYTSISIELTLEHGDDPDIYPSQMDTVTGVYGFEPSLMAVVENPDSVTTFRPTGLAYNIGATQCIIICNTKADGVMDEFQSLADWRTSQGIVTELVDYSEAIAGQSGADGTEKLRNYLRSKYQEDPYYDLSYVLLAGDNNLIPSRDNVQAPGYSDVKIKTDFYYADLDGSYWDDDNDGVYGEACPNAKVHLSFINSTTGWAYGGKCYKTTNGGSSWTAKGAVVDGKQIEDLKFTSSSLGWAISGETLYKTTDEGSSWSKEREGITGATSVAAVGTEVWVASSTDTVDRKNSGGQWATQLIDGSCFEIAFYDADSGWCVGEYIHKTSNGGTTWTKITNLPASCDGIVWKGIYLSSGKKVWIVGSKETILYSDDFGANWTVQNGGNSSGYTKTLNEVFFYDASNGWTVGSNGLVLTTSNAGSSWSSSTQDAYCGNLADVWLSSSTTAIATGNNSYLYRTTSGADDISQVSQFFGGSDLSSLSSHAELKVGRAPVSNAEEARIFIDKVIEYEKNPPSSDFAHNMLLMASDRRQRNDFPLIDCENLENNTGPYSFMSSLGFSYQTLFSPQTGSQWSGEAILNRNNAISEINKGYGMVFHFDLGNAGANYGTTGGDRIRVGGTGGSEEWLNTYDASRFNNEPSIFMSVASGSAMFYNTSQNCFGEEMLFNPGGGAVAYMGTVYTDASSYNDPYDSRMLHFLTGLYNPMEAAKAINRVGDGFAGSSDPVFHLLGDPAQIVWPNDPQSLTVTHPTHVNVATQTITITVSSSTTPKAVILYKPGDVIDPQNPIVKEGIIDINSNSTTISISPDHPGPLYITVLSQDYKIYRGICWVGDYVSHLEYTDDYMFHQASLGGDANGARGIAVDDDNNLHMFASTVESGSEYSMPYNYLFSTDNGNNWGIIKSIDPIPSNWSKGFLNMALGRGDRPYTAILTTNSGKWYIKIMDIWGNVSRTLEGAVSYGSVPSLAIDKTSNIGYVAVNNGNSRLYFHKFDLDYIDNTSKWNDAYHCETVAASSDHPSSAIMPNSRAIFVWTSPKPGDTQQRRDLYYYIPFEGKQPHMVDNTSTLQSEADPNIESYNDLLFLSYRYGGEIKARYGRTTSYPINWTASELVSSTSSLYYGAPRSTGVNVVTWGCYPDAKVYTSVRGTSGWSQQQELSPAIYPTNIWGSFWPQSCINYRNNRILVAWVDDCRSGDYIGDSISIISCDLADYPPGGTGIWTDVKLIRPTAGSSCTYGSNSYTTSFFVGYSNAKYAVRSFSVTGAGGSPETYILDTIPTPQIGLYSNRWKVGEYCAGGQKRMISPADYSNCYFDIKLLDANKQPFSPSKSTKEGPFLIDYACWPIYAMRDNPGILSESLQSENGIFSIPPHQNPGDTLAIFWDLQSCTGFEKVYLTYSTDNGEHWDTTSSECISPDSTVTDTFIVEIDSVTTDTLHMFEYSDTIKWVIQNEPTSSCFLRLTFDDSTALKDTLTAPSSFVISLPGGNENSTKFNQRMIGIGTQSGAIGMVYHGPNNEIYYTQSNKGWKLDEADSIATGLYPLQGSGSVFWLSNTVSASAKDTIRCSTWSEDSSSFRPYVNVLMDAQATTFSSKYAVPDVVIVNDTINMLTLHRRIQLGPPTNTYYIFERVRFHKDNPGTRVRDTFNLTPSGISGADTNTMPSISAAIKDSYLYMTLAYRDTICYWKTPLASPSIASIKQIGAGSCPNIALSDHNILLSYVSADSGSIIRLWDYIEDTDTFWTDRDTFTLGYDASCMAASEGLLYGVQQSDSILSHQYIFDPLTEQLIKEEIYEGYFSHPYLDTDSSFNRVTCYTWQYDSGGFCFKTDRTFLNGIYPALVIKPASIISPYTLYRNDYIFTDSVPADSSLDSVKYACSLDTAKLYGLAIEFYSQADTVTKLEIKVNNNVDTIDIPGGGEFSAYDASIPASADSCKISITRISTEGYVPVSRVVVRYRTEADMYTMGKQGPGLMGPEKITFCLFQPFPNPFSDAATIRYAVPYATSVSLKVYDISGRLVNTLEQGQVKAGVHTVRWSGKDQVNRKCASGIYFVRFVASGYVASKKMVMIK